MAALPDATQDGLRGFPNPIRPFYFDRFRYADATGTHDGWNDQYDRRQADLWRPYQRFSLIMQGNLDLDWGNNEEAYFEGYYFNRTNDVKAATEQIIPTVLGQVPLVDSTNTPILDDNGAMIIVDNPLNPFPVDVQPALTLSDVPQTFDTELQQIRLVTGLTGDLPFSESWSYDVAVSYDRATGFVKQPTLIEPHLFFATQSIGVVADANGNPTNQVVCGPRTSDLDFFLSMGGCVPADLLNMSVVGDGVTHSGRFATQAERDYLVANRTDRTVTELITFQAYATGDLFEIPGGGTAGAAVGVEYRVDTIDSQHSAVGVLGLNAAFNDLKEDETIGERDTFDAYAEVSLPLLVDKGVADLFQVDLAVRFTDDEYFGSDTVYKAGYLWDINEYVSWSSSFNTSFRAPNLHEAFLADFEGEILSSADPCLQQNVDVLEDGPTKDILLNNCALSGADVTVLGVDAGAFIPVSVGGALDLNPETSESLTSTITFSLPQRERFDFEVALTYFDIEIEDTVREQDPGTIISRCFFERPNLESAFCDRVERNRPDAPPESNFLSFVRAGFVNTGKESVNGYDLTTRMSFDVAGADVVWTTGSTFLKERLTQDFPPSEDDPNGSAIVDNVGRIGNPEVTFQSTVAVALNSWDFMWQARWWDDTQFPQGIVNPVITDLDGNIIGGKYDGMTCDEAFPEDGCADYGYSNSSQFDTDSLGPIRPITEAEGQMLHDLSVSYNGDTWLLTAGISNVFDEEPPLIDQAAGPNRNNAVTSAAYDNIGRSFFARFSISF
jgi:iron complex outermembrane receptor protein